MEGNMETSLFILFSEYCDASHAPSAVYIAGNGETELETIWGEAQKWLDMSHYFEYELCNRYYDSRNLEGLLYPYTLLENEYEEARAQEETEDEEDRQEYPVLNLLVKASLNAQGFVDWRDEAQEASEQFSWNDTDVTQDALGEMARRKKQETAVVLLNADAIRMPSPIQLSVSPTRETVDIDHCNTIPSLHQWFSENRKPQRIYDCNPKHGDDSHPARMIAGTGRRAAQLLTNQAETEQLLKLAVGTDTFSALWYYDEAHEKYIYFENQQERRLAFHGYHLSEGEENYSNIDLEKLEKIR